MVWEEAAVLVDEEDTRGRCFAPCAFDVTCSDYWTSTTIGEGSAYHVSQSTAPSTTRSDQSRRTSSPLRALSQATTVAHMDMLVRSNPSPTAPCRVGIHRTLVAVDFEETSRRALELGPALADHREAALTLVHVWDGPPSPVTSMASAMVRR